MARILKIISNINLSPDAEEILNDFFSGADNNYQLKRAIRNFAEYGGEDLETSLSVMAEELKNMRAVNGEIYFKMTEFSVDTLYALATAIAHAIEVGQVIIEASHDDNQPNVLFLIENGKFEVFSKEYCYEF